MCFTKFEKILLILLGFSYKILCYKYLEFIDKLEWNMRVSGFYINFYQNYSC